MLAKTAETSESEHASRSPSPEREARHAGGGLPGLSAGNRPNFTPPNRPPPAISEAGGELVQRDCDTCEEEPERKVRLSAAAGAVPLGAGGPPQPNSRASGVRIGAPGGPLEREADRAAAHVMGLASLDRPTPSARAAEREADAPEPIASYLRNLSGGVPLGQDSRVFFEPRFGRPLDHVRLHDDAAAAQTARGLGARAFAYGHHIGFAPGHFDPAGHEGRLLLAHEIAHVVQQPPHVSLKADDQAGDKKSSLPADTEPVLPTAVGAGKLREEVQPLLEKWVASTIGNEEQRKEALSTATFIIVGDLVSWYRNDGRLIKSFPLAAGVTTWAAGIYFRDTDDTLYRYVRLAGTPTFAPWVFSGKKVGLMKNWLRPTDVGAFTDLTNAVGGAPTAIVIPANPGDAARDSRGAQKLVEQVQKAFADKKAADADASGKTEKKDGGDEPADPDAPKVPPPTPQDELGDPPDRMVVWSDEKGVHVNVWVDQAVTSVEVGDDDTAEDLEGRIQEAADGLRESRDPGQSVGMADGAKTTGFAGKTQVSTQGAKHTANAPAYDSKINNYGPDTVVPGAMNNFEMVLDYSIAGGDTLSQVAARMQTIHYNWELLDVTDLTIDQLASSATAEVGSGDQATNLAAFRRDLERAGENVAEDTEADLKDLSSSWVPLPVKSGWLSVIGISNVVRLVGAPISSLIATATKPLNEQRITFDRKGDFLVRCVATPDYNDDDQVIRASSVATSLVRVEEIHARAATVADATDKKIAELEAQLANATTDKQRTDLQAQIKGLRDSLTETTSELGSDALSLINKQVAVAEALESANAAHTPREQRTPDVRLLAVQLELQKIKLDDYLKNLRQQKVEVEGRLSLIGGVVAGMPNGNHHPRVVLVSEETGRTYDVLTVLGEATDSGKDGTIHYQLADVSSPHPERRYIYDGTSKQEGLAGHTEAIRNAFVNFRENNGYGRGTIAIRLPSTLKPLGGEVQIESEMRSAPGTRERVMQRLKDLATAAEVAALFVGGPAGLAIGAVGGLAGAIVAVNDILSRREGTEFSWLSFQTIMDISSIVGGVVGIAGVGVLPLRNLPAWASRVERLQGVLHIFGQVQMAAQVIVIPVQLELELQAIDNIEGISDGERAARRAEAFLQAVRSGVVILASAAQMAGGAHGEEEQPLATEVEPRKPGEVTPEGEPQIPEGKPAAAEHPPVETKTTTTEIPAERLAKLQEGLGDHDIDIRGNSKLPGKSTRVVYREGEVFIEVGEGAGPEQIRSHLETAVTLKKYQGPLGALRRLISRITELLTGMPGHGTKGFESRLEVRKLNQIIETLRAREFQAQQEIEGAGTHEGAVKAAELEKIQRSLADLEYQLEYHEKLVDSLDPGSGYVAAFDRTTLATYPATELAAIEGGLTATGDETLQGIVDRMAELERSGRVAGLADWITEASLQSGDRAKFRARMAELANALNQAEGLPPDELLRLKPDGAAAGTQTFRPSAETIATGARVKGPNETALRAKFSASEQAAFDSLMQKKLADAGGDAAKFDANLAKTPEAVIKRQVTSEATQMAERARLTRHAANLADPLHPKLSTELAPGDPNGSATVYVHFEQPASGPGFNAGELTQAEHVQAETGEEVHFFGKDALLRDYPVIDGTIGDPRRPMQLKQTHAVDGASGARYQAQTALEAARVGSTKAIEVYIEALDFTRAQVEGAWGDPMVGRARGGGGVPSAPVFDGAIIGKIVVTCKGGERMVITPGATTFTYL